MPTKKGRGRGSPKILEFAEEKTNVKSYENRTVRIVWFCKDSIVFFLIGQSNRIFPKRIERTQTESRPGPITRLKFSVRFGFILSPSAFFGWHASVRPTNLEAKAAWKRRKRNYVRIRFGTIFSCKIQKDMKNEDRIQQKWENWSLGEEKRRKGHQKWAKGHQKWAKREPKGAKREPMGAKRVPKGSQMVTKMPPKVGVQKR